MVYRRREPGPLPRFPSQPFLTFFLVAGCTAPSPHLDQAPQVRRILSDARYEWVTLETLNTRIHVPVGSYAHANQEVVRQKAEKSRADVLWTLAEPGYSGTLDLFYVDAREDMGALTGTPVTGYSYFDDRAVVLVFNEEWRAFERHEFTHVVTLGTWADPSGMAVVEGLATYVDGECGGYANGRVARTVLDREGVIPLESLATDFRGQNDLAAYLQAAAVIEFMVSREGEEVIRLLWREGLQSAPTLLRIPADDFEAEFLEWLLSSFDPLPEPAWEAIRSGGCGISAPPPSTAMPG
jgi:hypothetical protein